MKAHQLIKDTLLNSATSLSTFSGIERSKIKISLSLAICFLVIVGLFAPVETIKTSALLTSSAKFSITDFRIDGCSFTKLLVFFFSSIY